MDDELNKATIKGHEGMRLSVYRDTAGKATIAYGFNLNASSAPALCSRAGLNFAGLCAGDAITEEQADAIFDLQYSQVAAQIRISLPAVDTYPANAAAVACDMCFQLGWGGFQEFRNTIAAFKAKSWAGVIQGIEESALARQTPNRVADNIRLLEAIDAD